MDCISKQQGQNSLEKNLELDEIKTKGRIASIDQKLSCIHRNFSNENINVVGGRTVRKILDSTKCYCGSKQSTCPYYDNTNYIVIAEGTYNLCTYYSFLGKKNVEK